MPRPTGQHALTFDQDDDVGLCIRVSHNPMIKTEVIVRHVKNALEHQPLHFCEQYFTFSQSRAHFLRHSNGRPQRSHVLGANPFLVWAVRGMI